MNQFKLKMLASAVCAMSLFSAHAETTYDWTGILKNPSFENGINNWNLARSVTGSTDIKIINTDPAHGAMVYNIWASKVKMFDLNQKVTLPAGEYKLSVQLWTNAVGVGNQHLYVKTTAGTYESPAITNASVKAWETVSVNFTLAEGEQVTIGVNSTADGSSEKGWFRADNFRLMSNLVPGAELDQEVAQVTSDLSLTSTGDLRITGTDPFAESATVDITSDQAAIYFENLRPALVKAQLSHVKINGTPAVANSNCQLRLYDHGTLLLPYAKEGKADGAFHPLTVYSEQYCAGDSYSNFGIENTNGFMNTLSTEALNNRIRSFRLKRGYMVTFALGVEGHGYQRCFIADKEDLVVNVLPAILDNRISSYRVFRFDNIGKNGVANITDQARLKRLNCTWTYTWGAGQSIGTDYECVPHMNHLWSTSILSLGANDLSPYLKTDNEPANSADPSPATVAQELERWPELMRTGRRLLSPSSYDGGVPWHTQFFDSIDARGWRCDICDIHSYWNEGTYDGIKSNWVDKFKRPVWITEFIWGASWSGGLGIFNEARTSEERNNPPQYILDKNKEVMARILPKLNAMQYVERYAYWNDEAPCSKLLWGDKITPTGEFYAQMKTGPSYSGANEFIPKEWRCDAPKNLLATYNFDKKKCEVKWTSRNCDLTETMTLQRRIDEGEWVDLKQWVRPDSVDFLYEDSVDINLDYSYRVVMKTWKNKEVASAPMALSLYLINGGINAESKTSIMGWTCERNAEAGNTKHASGDTYFEVWDSKAENIDFNYYQDIEDLPNGVYRLQAACFNSTNNVAGATVNGRMGLYAEAEGSLYFSPVTVDSELDKTRLTYVDTIVVRKGKMRIGIRNIGRMSARWAGADNFKLIYLGTEDEVLTNTTYDEILQRNDNVVLNTFPELENGQRDASGLIMNTDCNFGNTTFWTVTSLGTSSGEAFDGVSTNKYFDKSASNLNSSLKQTINCMPTGRYLLTAALRGSTNTTLTVNATYKQANGVNKVYNGNAKGAGNTAVEGSPYQNGWMEVASKEIIVTPGGQLTVGARGANAAANSWWSADRFRLTYLGPDNSGVADAVTSALPVSTVYYNLQGQQIARPVSGLYIEQTLYSDGTTRSEKKIQ